MCVIAIKNAGQELPEDMLKMMIKANGDGVGFVWHDGTTAHAVKGLMREADALREWARVPKDAPAIFHARIGTHGTHDVEQTHPFFVTSKTSIMEKTRLRSCGGYFVAHNGILSGLSIGKEYSDTEALVALVLHPLAAHGFDLLGDDARGIIETVLGGNNRLAVMDCKTGKIATFGSWSTYKGVKVSNTHFTYTPQSYYQYGTHVGAYSDYDEDDYWQGWRSYGELPSAKAANKTEKKAKAKMLIAVCLLGAEDEELLAYRSDAARLTPTQAHWVISSGMYYRDSDGNTYCYTGGMWLRSGYTTKARPLCGVMKCAEVG